MIFKTVFITLYIALIPILGCGPPEDYIPVSQLVFPGYLGASCNLGYQCEARIWFFTDHFYYNAEYYTKNQDLTSLSDCSMSGNWTDFNTGQSIGNLSLNLSLDTCQNSINTILNGSYDTTRGVVTLNLP